MYHQLLFCLTWILKGKPHRRDSSFKNYVYYIISLSERKTSFFFPANIAQIFYHQCTYKIAYIFFFQICSFLFFLYFYSQQITPSQLSLFRQIFILLIYMLHIITQWFYDFGAMSHRHNPTLSKTNTLVTLK